MLSPPSKASLPGGRNPPSCLYFTLKARSLQGQTFKFSVNTHSSYPHKQKSRGDRSLPLITPPRPRSLSESVRPSQFFQRVLYLSSLHAEECGNLHLDAVFHRLSDELVPFLQLLFSSFGLFIFHHTCFSFFNPLKPSPARWEPQTVP